MTDNVIDYAAIRARLNAATEGPWAVWHDLDHQGFRTVGDAESYAEILSNGITEEAEPTAHVYTDEDAELIAHSRTDLEQLLDRVEALEGVYAAVQSVHYMIRVGEARPVLRRVCVHCATPWPCQTIRVIEANSGLAAVPAAGEEKQ